MTLTRAIRVAWWSIPALVAACLAAPSISLPGDDAGIRRFRTPSIGSDLRIGQTFMMTGDGLYAIEIWPARTGVPRGDVRFELYDMRGDQLVPIRIQEVLSADVVSAPSYRFEFRPVTNSRDRMYRLDLVASPAEGVAFWATRGERYDGGSLHANGRARWADLVFRVYAPAPSIWGRLMAFRAANPIRAHLAIAALIANWLFLGVVVRAFEKFPPESAPAGS